MKAIYILKNFKRIFPFYASGEVEDLGYNTIRITNQKTIMVFEYHSDDAYYLQIFPNPDAK